MPRYRLPKNLQDAVREDPFASGIENGFVWLGFFVFCALTGRLERY